MPGKTMIYVGAEADGLYRKEESDGKWEKLAKGMPPSPQVRAIAIHPNDSKTIFVGTQRGVYRSQNGGDSYRTLVQRSIRGDISSRRFAVKRAMWLKPVE